MMIPKDLQKPELEVLQMPGLSRFCNISHFMTTRQGGVSSGNFASLNLGLYSGDNPACVEENYRILASCLGLFRERIVVPHQTHGTEIAFIGPDFLSQSEESRNARLEGIDALVTDVPGVCVAVATADCVPVLLYAPDKQVVAAVHAGWRGTVGQIVSRTVREMVRRYQVNPETLYAALGPSISWASFEVGMEVVQAFRRSGAWNPEELDVLVDYSATEGKAHLDLWQANVFLLRKCGLVPEHIEVAGICTYRHEQRFFSARRLGIQSGRLLSGIYIKEK